MRCPWCGNGNDRVVDSRSVEGGRATRRRRECSSCGRRYTSFERVEDAGLSVIKRDGARETYDRAKVVAGIEKAIVNRPVEQEQVEAIADRVETALRAKGPRVTTQDIGLEVLAQLARVDQVAYIRFASVYKDFQQLTDFERELGMLLQKRDPGKR